MTFSHLQLPANKFLSKNLHFTGARYKYPSSHLPSTGHSSNILDSSVFILIKINFQGFVPFCTVLYRYDKFIFLLLLFSRVLEKN